VNPSEDRARRRRRARRRLIRQRIGATGVLAVGAVAGLALAFGSHDRPLQRSTPGANAPASTTLPARGGAAPRLLAGKPLAPPTHLSERRIGTLPAPLEDPGAALAGSRVVLAGGLTAQDTSTAAVIVVRGSSARTSHALPAVQHDAAAAGLAGSVYVFGGGDGLRQLDHILRIDSRSGRATRVGSLPAASSDSSAAAVGSTAYVVGGYTGRRWLDTIVAYRAGDRARVVAHLPVGVRYAAVAAVGTSLLIAGGSLADGSASRAIYRFDPGRRVVRRIGSLPVATTHAAAASLGGTVFVIGGRGAALGSVSSEIVAIDPRTGRSALAGHLQTARSDLAAVAVGHRILIAGGGTSRGVTDAIGELVASSPRTLSLARGVSANVYAADRANALTGAARRARALVYVPNSQSGTLDVIDQHSFKVIAHYRVGALPQHVTPSYDLRTLYVDNDLSNSLTPINPATGRLAGRPIPVTDPYNLYFTPDGRYAIVVAEARSHLDFRTAHGMRLTHSLAVPCRGVDHMDFSADGSMLLASCEFSSEMIAVNVAHQRVTRVLHLPRPGMPQDVKLSPDGRTFFVADMAGGGVWLVDARTLRIRGFIRTGAGAHGLYPSRDARRLYVTNRAAGTVSVLSFATHRILATWHIPNGTPDMGGVSADGRTLWLSGRYRSEVYAIDTRTGRLRARIPVGSGPHGLCVWPQPGRYSLGHTGILR
jgi:DNA-binding beta-propeller fold protein YncE